MAFILLVVCNFKFQFKMVWDIYLIVIDQFVPTTFL